MAKLIMRVEGTDGQLELMTDRVVIHRQGVFNMFKYGLAAKKEIPLAAISNIGFRDANILKPGEINFEYAGRSQKDDKANKVAFMRKKQNEFYQFKEKLFDLMNQQRRT